MVFCQPQQGLAISSFMMKFRNLSSFAWVLALPELAALALHAACCQKGIPAQPVGRRQNGWAKNHLKNFAINAAHWLQCLSSAVSVAVDVSVCINVQCAWFAESKCLGTHTHTMQYIFALAFVAFRDFCLDCALCMCVCVCEWLTVAPLIRVSRERKIEKVGSEARTHSS